MTDALIGDETSHREPGGTVRLLALHNTVAPGHGHVVYHPLVHIVLVDTVI